MRKQKNVRAAIVRKVFTHVSHVRLKMSEEDTVSYHEEEMDEREEEWSRALIKEYEIRDQEVIHKIKLHERIAKLEKKNAHLEKLLRAYQLSQIECVTTSFTLSDFPMGKKRTHQKALLFEQNKQEKKPKYDVNLIDFSDFVVSDDSPFM